MAISLHLDDMLTEAPRRLGVADQRSQLPVVTNRLVAVDRWVQPGLA